MNESTAILDSIQILPLGESEISPLITKVKIKVFHLGENRNRSYIDKETAINMGKTLRGAPIVGYYREEKGDFTDHGQEVVINDKGVTFNTLTKPYGFVDLNAKIWFEDYIDIDEFGNQLQHTYLVTEGIVWTEQYPELKESLISEGARPQSMELDEGTLKGHWAGREGDGLQLFIIDDAVITKLCMLGEDVEPCFIGSSVDTDVSSNFTKETSNFMRTLFSMMQELQTALKGEQDMEKDFVFDEAPATPEAPAVEPVAEEVIEEVSEETPVVEEEAPVIEEPVAEPEVEEPIAEVEEPAVEPAEEVTEVEEVAEPEVTEEAPAAEVESDFVKKEDEAEEEESKEEESESASEEDEEDDENKKKYALLEQKYEELETKFAAMSEEYQALVEFKNSVELEKKDALIESFYMLDDEDKADVVANKATYSLDEIESKLSVAFTRKQMAIEKETAEVEATQEDSVGAITYTLNDTMDSLPAWVRAVRDTEKAMN